MADDEELRQELADAAAAIGALARDEDTFRSAVDAFRAADRDSFQRLLAELNIADRCGLVCEWIRSKECVLLCLELAGPPPGREVPDLRRFAETVVRITGDEELVERVAGAVANRDPDRFRQLLDELEASPLAHLLCRWVCAVRTRLLCRVVCGLAVAAVPPLEDELAAAGRAVGTLLADQTAFAEVERAVLAGRCEPVRAALARAKLIDDCHLVCEWLCSWRCLRVCLLIAERFPLERADLREAFAFAQVTALLADNAEALARLTAAVEAEDPDASPPDSTNSLAKIHVNNWAEVNLLDIAEFHTGGGTACTGITTSLHVEYTTDHEQMKAWEAVITSAALGAPITVAGGPDALHPRGDAASQSVATGGFAPCSYVVTLSTRAGLTTGLTDNTGRSQQRTFCVR